MKTSSVLLLLVTLLSGRPDVALAGAAVVAEGRDSGERGDLAAGGRAELGQQRGRE